MIKISDYLKPECIKIADAKDKWDLLAQMVGLLDIPEKNHISRDYVYQKVVEREKIFSTGIGKGIAVPHLRIEGIEKFHTALAILKNPIPYASIDDKPVRFVMMVIIPSSMHKEYLKILAALVLIFKNENTISKILECTTSGEIYGILCEL